MILRSSARPLVRQRAAVPFGSIYRKQRALLLQDIGLLICRGGAIIVGGLYFSALEAVVLYSFVGVAFNAFIIVWMWNLLRKQNERVSA